MINILIYIAVWIVAIYWQLVIHEVSHVAAAVLTGTEVTGIRPYPHWYYQTDRAEITIPFWEGDFWSNWRGKKNSGMKLYWGSFSYHGDHPNPQIWIAPVYGGSFTMLMAIFVGFCGSMTMALLASPFFIMGLLHVLDFHKDFFTEKPGSDGYRWKFAESLCEETCKVDSPNSRKP